MGWGGARMNAGRKPKDAERLKLAGGRNRRKSAAKSAEMAQAVPQAPVEAPTSAQADVLAVFAELAPQATQSGTLTAGTAAAFLLLCQNVVLERRLRLGSAVGGGDHRGMIRIVEIGMARFCLAPNGKAAAVPEKPVD